MNPLTIQVTITEHQKSYSPLFTENVLGWPDWVPPTPEQVEAHDKLWEEELCNCNFLRAVLLDAGADPKCQLVVESAWFLRDDPQARSAVIPDLFKTIGQAIQTRSLINQTAP